MLEAISPYNLAQASQASTYAGVQHTQTVLVSRTLRWSDVSLLDFLRRGTSAPRIYWESEEGALGFAGYGAAAVLTAAGPDRFRAIRQGMRRLFENAIWETTDAPPQAGPRLFGGFSFDPHHIPQRIWAAFPAAYFVLPRYQLTRFEGQNWLTINCLVNEVGSGNGRLESCLELPRAVDDFGLSTRQTSSPPSFRICGIEYPVGRDVWCRLIEEAVHQIHRGELDKVVLARTCDVHLDRPVQPTGVLARLRTRYPDCFRFLIEPVSGHAFFGATPELLVEVGGTPSDMDRSTFSGSGGSKRSSSPSMVAGNLVGLRDRLPEGQSCSSLAIRAVAMAGSVARGNSPEEDEALGRQLMTSPKERQEHAFVVDAVEASLRPLVTELHVPEQPALRRFRNIQHLETVIRGALAEGYDVLSAVEVLHPTPAVGGVPRVSALQAIAERELLPRGWYAAPVGWMDAHGHGLFAVAIRSAVSVGSRARLYAGAGIVADSDPEREWAETGLKFRPMLEALGGLVNP